MDETSFLTLYKGVIRPLIEYATTVWSPYKKGQINAIENVQRRATNLIPGLHNMTYEERLQHLKLPTLFYRRLRGDMLMTHKLLTGKYDKNAPTMLLELDSSKMGRNSNSLSLKRANTQDRGTNKTRTNFFSNRVISEWNKLPNKVVESKTPITFKSSLDKHWKSHRAKYSIIMALNADITT